tara:strand:+ start:353 stop:526 length:174 start_codon:yes stop_codon:yes gene_type:complete
MTNKKGPYLELILYLKSLIIILESIDKPDTEEDAKMFRIGTLNDIKSNIDSLMKKLS